MTQIAGLLLALFRFAELFLRHRTRQLGDKRTRHAILTLQKYKERFEKALLARRETRSGQDDPVAPPVAPIDGNNRLPDDGYRRD